MNNGEQFEIKSIAELEMCHEVYGKEWNPSYYLEDEVGDFINRKYRFVGKINKVISLGIEVPVCKTVPPPDFILQYREAIKAIKPKRPMRLEEVPVEIGNQYLPVLHDFVNFYLIWKSWGTNEGGLRMEFGPEFYAAFKDQIQEIEKALK
jgi:hypothetical protein